MTPEAAETISVGLGFTVSASSQFSRHHGNKIKLIKFYDSQRCFHFTSIKTN